MLYEVITVGLTFNVVQTIMSVVVGICAVYALTRTPSATAQDIRELYNENKADRKSTESTLRDHEGRIAKLEGRASHESARP